MPKFTYSIPSEFSDEDKWLKFFRKKDMAVLIVTGAITVGLYKLTGLLIGNAIIGLIIGLLIMGVSMFCSMFPIPDTFYLTGGGQTIATLMIRRLIRKKKRVIYVKGYGKRKE